MVKPIRNGEIPLATIKPDLISAGFRVLLCPNEAAIPVTHTAPAHQTGQVIGPPGPHASRRIELMQFNYKFSDELKQRISGHLKRFPRRELTEPTLRQAGVALVVAPHSDAPQSSTGACLLLTRRSTKMRRHAGQYALPGGRLDDGETFEDAALRELSEELGLHYGAENVLGTLDDYRTQSGFCIRPFVIWGGSLAEMKPDPVEVAKVFEIPLGDLDNPEIPRLSPGEHPDRPVLGAPIAVTGHVVHAPTAALIYQFREVAMHGRPTRVDHFGQPQFAWK